MKPSLIGRIYLRREKDVVHILSIKTDPRKGDIYFSIPINNTKGESSIKNAKFSYHADGQTFINIQVPALKNIDDNIKRKTTKGLGHCGDKAYTLSVKKTPLSEISVLVVAGNGMSYKDVNTMNHDMMRIVDSKDVKPMSGMFDCQKFKNLSLGYLIYAPKLDNEPGVASIGGDECFVFPHPVLNLSIIVSLHDYWKED